MLQSETILQAGSPASAIARLCKHFSHKIPADWDEHGARLQFPTGDCEMTAGDASVHVLCRAADEAALTKLQQVLDRHIPKLLWRDEQTVVWSDSIQVQASASG